MKSKIYLSICFIVLVLAKGYSQIDTSRNITLPGGNYIVKDPFFDEDTLTDIGIIRLYDGITNNLISTVKGAKSGDKVGNDGIAVLSNGNFLVYSTVFSDYRGGYPQKADYYLTWVKNGLSQQLTVNNNNSINYTRNSEWILNPSYYTSTNYIKTFKLPNGNFYFYITERFGFDGIHTIMFYKVETNTTKLNNDNGKYLLELFLFDYENGSVFSLFDLQNSNIVIRSGEMGNYTVNTYDGFTGEKRLEFLTRNSRYDHRDTFRVDRCIKSIQIIENILLKIKYVSCPQFIPHIRLNAEIVENPIIDIFANTNQSLSGAEPFVLVNPIGTNSLEKNQYTAKVWLNEANTFNVNDKYYVSRHFEISPVATTPAITAKVKLYFTQGEFDNYNNLSGSILKLPASPTDSIGKQNLQVVKYAGTSNTNYGLPDSYGSTNEIINPDDAQIIWNGTMWEVGFDVTSFSGFFISTSFPVALPLTLESFTAKNIGLQNELNWQTSNEANTQSFQIERSIDAQKFEKIGVVSANNTKELNKYQFIDNDVSSYSTFYYRLKMNDLDGKNTFSKIISITNENQLFTITPNPVIDKLTVNFGDHEKYLNSNCKLVNSIGQTIKELKIIKPNLEVDLNDLPAGIYFIVLNDGNKVKFLKK